MEKLNFYQLKVGRTSRRGSFECLIDKVVSSSQNQKEVTNFFRKNYEGLEVYVSTIENIDRVVAPEIVENDFSIYSSVKETQFFSTKTKIDFKRDERLSVLKLKKEYLEAEKKYKKDLIDEINSTFRVIGEFYNFKDFDITDSYYNFEVKLYGSVYDSFEKLH